MLILFILGLLLGGVSVIFALENTAIVTVVFYSWHFTSSLAVIIILSILVGIIITLLILLPGSIDGYYRSKGLKKEVVKLEEELRKQIELTVFAKTTTPSPETIKKIEDGVSIH